MSIKNPQQDLYETIQFVREGKEEDSENPFAKKGKKGKNPFAKKGEDDEDDEDDDAEDDDEGKENPFAKKGKKSKKGKKDEDADEDEVDEGIATGIGRGIGTVARKTVSTAARIATKPVRVTGNLVKGVAQGVVPKKKPAINQVRKESVASVGGKIAVGIAKDVATHAALGAATAGAKKAMDARNRKKGTQAGTGSRPPTTESFDDDDNAIIEEIKNRVLAVLDERNKE